MYVCTPYECLCVQRCGERVPELIEFNRKTNTAGQCSAVLEDDRATTRKPLPALHIRKLIKYWRGKPTQTERLCKANKKRWDKSRRHKQVEGHRSDIVTRGAKEKTVTLEEQQSWWYSAPMREIDYDCVFIGSSGVCACVHSSPLFVCHSVPRAELRGHLEEQGSYLNHVCEC